MRTGLWEVRVGTDTLVGELVDALKFLVDGLSQSKGIGSVSKVFKRCYFERIGLRASRHPLKGGLWLVIAAFELGTDARLTDQLHGRQEEVLEGSQFVSVKIIHRLVGRKRVIAQVAEDFAYMGPVFLFDMGVVVFFVGTSSGELDFFLIAERFEMIVDELRAVVGIDS